LALINELDETSGKRTGGKLIKQRYSQGKYQNTEIANLIGQIQANPKEESTTFANFLVPKNNETDKVLETARKLELAIPTSDGPK
jgi:hypothetical protein